MSLEILFSCVSLHLRFLNFAHDKVSESRSFVLWKTVSIKTMIKLFI